MAADYEEKSDDARPGTLIPAPPSRDRRLSLHSVVAVRRELARVYRDARAGRLPTADATRLGYLLDLMRRAIESSDLEARIAALEAERGAK